MNTKVMNKINDNVNMKVAIKLDETRNDVKYDGLYPVTPVNEIIANSEVCSGPFVKPKEKMGSHHRDHQYYVTALLDMALKITRRC